MGKGRKKDRDRSKQRESEVAPGGRSRRGGRTEGEAEARASWLSSKRPVLRFVLVFGAVVVAFNALFWLWLSKTDVFYSYLNVNAAISGWIIGLFGDDVTVAGRAIASSRFNLNVEKGCDAIQASAFFAIGILAAPVRVSWGRRLVPLVLGTLCLLVVNLARIVTLYYIGVHWPKAFDTMHIDVWQAVFVFLPLILWLGWVRWAIRAEHSAEDESGDEDRPAPSADDRRPTSDAAT